MSDDTTRNHPPPSAEEKRQAARRHFLSRGARGALGGSGLLVTTFWHQRAFAQTTDWYKASEEAKKKPGSYKPQGVLVSTQLRCASLQGTVVQNVTVLDENARPATRYDCVKR